MSLGFSPYLRDLNKITAAWLQDPSDSLFTNLNIQRSELEVTENVVKQTTNEQINLDSSMTLS